MSTQYRVNTEYNKSKIKYITIENIRTDKFKKYASNDVNTFCNFKVYFT